MKHLRESGKSYYEHFKFAFWYGLVMILGGIASIVHAIFPPLLPGVADNIARLLTIVVNNLDKFRSSKGLPQRTLPECYKKLLLK